MISLRKSLDEIENLEARFRVSLKSYTSVINSIRDHGLIASEDAAENYRKRLSELRFQVLSQPTVAMLESSSVELDRELRSYRKLVEAELKRRDAEFKDILTALAEAASILDRQSHSYTNRFGEFARKLDEASRLDNLGEIRRKLTDEVSLLKATLHGLSHEAEVALMHLRGELQAFQSRLEKAEALAATDCLTGLANRREAERRIAAKVNAGNEFSIMFLDIDKFKQLNDRFGHACGDQVLSLFAKRLREQVRPTDLVCRWGGDEFLVILDCRLEEAMHRARQVGEQIGGIYGVRSVESDVRIPVRASIGVAEYRPSDTPEDLFARADNLLYKSKALKA